MIRVLQSSWVTALVGGLLYLGVTATLITPAQFDGFQLPSSEPTASAADDPSWKFRNPELEQWIAEIKHEKESLAEREQQLRQLEIRLAAERQELNSVTQTVFQLQAEFDRNVLRIHEQEAANLKRQARVFSGMPPNTVAGIIRDMTDDDATRVLFYMKPDEVSAILEILGKMGAVESRRAAAISERTRRTLPPESNAPKATSG